MIMPSISITRHVVSALLGSALAFSALFMSGGCSSPTQSVVVQTTSPAATPTDTPRATVWLFISTDCPICNGYQPELERMRARYSPLGIDFIGVYPEVPLSAQEVADHVRDFAITYPTVIDSDRSLRKRFSVRFVPEVIVTAGGHGAAVDQSAFLYRGRIDDQYPERGSRRPSATEHDLENALQAITTGRVPNVRVTTPVGCVLEP